ncbi:MAG: hypothetical protein ACE5J2_03660 [Nitrososphaerales archaeon]
MLEDLLRDILNEDNVLMSVNTGGAIIEMRVRKGLQFRVKENWITIGDDQGPCHMHVNKNEIKEVRFVKEDKETRVSYSIRLLNAKRERIVAAFFTKMYDDSGNPVHKRIQRYEQIFKKYGSRQVIPLQK